MSSYCNVQLRVIRGHELPKTDLFSQIDPYVVVSFMGETLGRTVTRDNNPNPIWQEDFFFEAEEDDGSLFGTIALDLYDEEVAKDEYVGSIRLDLQDLTAEMLLEPIELPVVYKNDKRGQKLAKGAPRARLALQVVSIGKAFSSYMAELDGVEGVIVDEPSGTVLVPVSGTEGALWTGLQFTRRSTQLLVLSTEGPKASPNGTLRYDVSYSGSPSLRVERLQHRKPMKIQGLKVWTELRVTNLPLDAKLSKVRIVERDHRLVDTLDPADVLVTHGYMIGMPFLAAVKELSKRPAVHVDVAAQAIWIRMDSNQPQPAQLLQLDYSNQRTGTDVADATVVEASADASPGGKRGTSGGGGRKSDGGRFPALRICSTSSDLNKGYELGFFGDGGRSAAGPLAVISETFRRPKPVLDGVYDIVHTVELRDAFVGDTLEEIGLGCYELIKTSRTWRFGKLIDSATRGDFQDIEESANDGRGTQGGGADRSDGGGRSAAAVDLFRSLLSWLQCMASPRADPYLEKAQDAPKPRKGGRAAKHARRDDAEGEDDYTGRSGGGRRSTRSSGGTGREGTSTPTPPMPPAGRSGTAAGRAGNARSTDGGMSGGGGGGAVRSNVGVAASIGSSSDRSASLATYNSTKMKYSDNKYGNSGGRGGKLKTVRSNASMGKYRAGSDED